VICPPEPIQEAAKHPAFVRAEVFNDFVEIYVVKFVHTFLNARTPPSFHRCPTNTKQRLSTARREAGRGEPPEIGWGSADWQSTSSLTARPDKLA
jgi:hypothetical protein